MVNRLRVVTIVAVVVSMIATAMSTTVAAGGQEPIETPHLTIPSDLFATPEAPAWDEHGAIRTGVSPTASIAFDRDPDVFAQRGYGRRGRGRNGAAQAAIILGAAAAIAGTAVLVYANRPECTTNPNAGGCGYGTKVVGGAVLSAGIVGVLVGALTWR